MGFIVGKLKHEGFSHFRFLVPVVSAPLMLCADPSLPVKGTDFIQQV